MPSLRDRVRAMTCWLTHLGPCEYRPDGQPDAAHIGFSKRELRAIWERESAKRKIVGEHPNESILALGRDEFACDRRLIRPLCRLHHNALDNPNQPPHLRWEQLPESVLEFADEFGLLYRLEHSHPRTEAA